jgi:hypothetical protein
MSYDLILRAKRDLSAAELGRVRDALQSAVGALDGDVVFPEPQPRRAGERLGVLALGIDLGEELSAADAEAVTRLVDVATETGIEIYDPQQSVALTKKTPT